MWFGPDGRPLFARYYLPDGELARGVVVLCPPFGVEAEATARAYRLLGEQLAAARFAVLQIDYDGTGDSAGLDTDPGRLEAWQASVRAAVDFARSAGARQVSVLGMRLGATIAASVAAGCDLDALVLWDPCDSGRSYLRDQELLRRVYMGDDRPEAAVGGPGTASVEVLGAVYGPETVAELTGLTLAGCEGELAKRALVLLRPGRRVRKAVSDWLSVHHVEVEPVGGQEELLGSWYGAARVPESTLGTIESVVSWLSGAVGLEEHGFELDKQRVARLKVLEDEVVTEEIVSLGPNKLFGIMATRAPGYEGGEPVGGQAPTTVVVLNSGWADHTGPGRLWVGPAREWAQSGLSVLRVDLSGLGDSRPRPGEPSDVVYPPCAMEDIMDIASELSPDGMSSLVLVGLCSGARHAIEAGMSLGARGVVAVNPAFPPAPSATKASRQPDDEASVLRPPGWLDQARRALYELGRRHRSVHAMGRSARGLSHVLWWLANRLGERWRPFVALRRLVERGAETYVICDTETGWLVTRGELHQLRALERTGIFRLDVLGDVDHTLYSRRGRDQVLPRIREHLVSRYVARIDLKARRLGGAG
ncbi:MAG: alpha/beta fold hydrolase [Acidimicrobiales bacterium]